MEIVEREYVQPGELKFCPKCGGSKVSCGPWQTMNTVYDPVALDCADCGARLIIEDQPPECRLCGQTMFDCGEERLGADLGICEDCFDATQGTGLPSPVGP